MKGWCDFHLFLNLFILLVCLYLEMKLILTDALLLIPKSSSVLSLIALPEQKEASGLWFDHVHPHNKESLPLFSSVRSESSLLSTVPSPSACCWQRALMDVLLSQWNPPRVSPWSRRPIAEREGGAWSERAGTERRRPRCATSGRSVSGTFSVVCAVLRSHSCDYGWI